MHLQALLLQLARHLGCYVQLGAEAASEYRSTWVRRAVLALVAVATSAVAAMAAWAAGSCCPMGYPMAAGLCRSHGGRAGGRSHCAVLPRVHAAPQRHRRGNLESELRKDVELFQQWKSTL